ncbi:LysR family transcriptional regulator [Aureimonas jatrophae]|uniref:Transcriptional regulator n=1 Tax=Aureimonas jatrophae TaxID=1166073 RepID=A0A1H0EK75_9HYPH|nr:LysR family transcriptional regulator [Aureimonas jatrophae]SDN82669.1 transcriptional regulator [Aureimonas jatrophae]
MARVLPPLSALRAFEAAARHLSFTRAAAELGMTQAAVSYQIRVLEERVGTPLFLRGARQVVLTDAGRRLGTDASGAFDLISASFEAVRSGTSGVLTISVIPTFATLWLARHLYAFQLAHPDIAVRLQSNRVFGCFFFEAVVLALWVGVRLSPGLVLLLLVRAAFPLVLLPRVEVLVGLLLRERGDVVRSALLGSRAALWQEWFALAGVGRAVFGVVLVLSLLGLVLGVVGVLAGGGVLMVPPFFCRGYVAAVRVGRAFDVLFLRGLGLCVWCGPGGGKVPQVGVFGVFLVLLFRALSGWRW